MKILKRVMFIGFVVGLLKGSSCFAAVFLAPTASSDDFHRYVLQTNQQSYVQWYQQQHLQKSAEVQSKVSEFAQSVLTSPSPLSESQKKDWQNLRGALELTSDDREVLALLAEKKHFSTELCGALALEPELQKKMEKPVDSNFCKEALQESSARLLEAVGEKDLIAVDGVLFEKERIPKRFTAGIYHWKYISNRFRDMDHTGSVESFIQALQSKVPWVEGDCQMAKLNHPDFSVLTAAKIYFSDSCTPPGLPPERNLKTWAAENKKLLWGVGIVLGVFAAYQLRDKTLVITTP